NPPARTRSISEPSGLLRPPLDDRRGKRALIVTAVLIGMSCCSREKGSRVAWIAVRFSAPRSTLDVTILRGLVTAAPFKARIGHAPAGLPSPAKLRTKP